MRDSTVVNELEQLPVISDYAGQPLSFSSLLPTMSAKDSPALCKYWSQRYRLFSRYDQGIQMDKGETMREGEAGTKGERERGRGREPQPPLHILL